MFGTKRRAAQRERDIREAAELAASMRTDFMEALQEVLRSRTELTLRVGDTELKGSNGACTMSDSMEWLDGGYFLRQVQRMQQRLGRGYDVVGCAWVTVERVPFGVAMDLASGYHNPRLHAIEYDTTMATVQTAADVERYGRALNYPSCHWITIRRTKHV